MKATIERHGKWLYAEFDKEALDALKNEALKKAGPACPNEDCVVLSDSRDYEGYEEGFEQVLGTPVGPVALDYKLYANTRDEAKVLVSRCALLLGGKEYCLDDDTIEAVENALAPLYDWRFFCQLDRIVYRMTYEYEPEYEPEYWLD